MYEFSTDDGFIDVNRSLEEMIKYLANEPSVGLFFVQQHAQNGMPNLLSLKNKVVEKTCETILHTEDLEDSICALRSMTECGLSIADGMIKDINKSLLLISTAKPRKGLIRNPSWGFQMSRGIPSEPATAVNSSSGSAAQQDEGTGRSNYLTTVFNSAKQRAVKLRWPQADSSMKKPSSTPTLPPISTGAIGTPSPHVDTETEELPLSSSIADDQQLGERGGGGGGDVSESSPGHDLSPMLEVFDKFKSDQEAKLEEWLQGSEDHHSRCTPEANN